jgi:hypothetical protein
MSRLRLSVELCNKSLVAGPLRLFFVSFETCSLVIEMSLGPRFVPFLNAPYVARVQEWVKYLEFSQVAWRPRCAKNGLQIS